MTDETNPLDVLRRSVPDDDRLESAIADRIESRLRVAHAEANPSRPVRWWRPALAAPIAVLLVVALSLAVVLRTSDPAAALVVTDAENVTVRLPDGSLVIDPEDGYELPDGAVLEIGLGGMVTVDDVVLDSAGVLAVRDGRLVADVVATTTTPDRPDHLAPDPTTTVAPVDVVTTTTTAAPTTTVPVDPEPTEPEPSDRTTTTARADRTDRDEREPTDDRDGARGDEDDRRAEEPLDAPITVSIALELDRVDSGVRVSWAVDGLQPGWSVVILRTIGDNEPSVIVSTADPTGQVIDQPTRADGRPAERRAGYRVIVIDEADGEVASGPKQSLR